MAPGPDPLPARPAVPTYTTLERLSVSRPVDRLEHLTALCTGKVVLDIGCLDETALVKRDTQHWLHGRIAQVARQVVGIDSSDQIPPGGLATAAHARIHRGDAMAIDSSLLQSAPFDLVVAGEFIEHVRDPLQFLAQLRQALPGRELVLTTPNGPSAANALMGCIGREAQHPDHLANFSYKILHTLCRRAGFEQWEVRPYRFFATEMILNSQGWKRAAAQTAQGGIRVVERLFPLLSFGWIVRARL
jgi:SAM-dependent methyltransferase